jgi:preprotein translocase subunit SecA
MLEAIKEESVGYLFNVEVQVRKKEEPALTTAAAARTAAAVGGSASATAVATAVEEDEEVEDAASPVEEAEPAEDVVVPGFGEGQPNRLQYSAPSEDGTVERHSETADEYSGTARNAPCPCGSGKKYKKCHGDPAAK